MMESREQGLMARSDTDRFMNYRIIIVTMVVLCLGCIGADKPEVSETVLDTVYHGQNRDEYDNKVNVIWEDNPGVFDIILDAYISFNELNGRAHYIKVSTDEETVKDQVVLRMEYRYVNIDELVLPAVYLEGELQGVKVYCTIDSERTRFPIDHNMALKRMNNARKYEWKDSNEYFNDISLSYDMKKKTVISVAKGFPPDTVTINQFEGVFRDRGIMD